MMLSSRDQAAIVEEMVTWMAAGLTVGNVDASKVVVRGYYSAESLSVVLVVEELSRRRGSTRRPVANHVIARATVSTDPALRGEQSRAGLDYMLRIIKGHASRLMLPEANLEIESAPILPPTAEEWREARQILDRLTARHDQRPSKQRGGDAGTPGRTTHSS